TENPEEDRDLALFARLGIRPQAGTVEPAACSSQPATADAGCCGGGCGSRQAPEAEVSLSA
ncbi:MAG UNVERIFIED_CONTAM: hypothetical protein LOD86_06630, partial [Thermobifida fusca]